MHVRIGLHGRVLLVEGLCRGERIKRGGIDAEICTRFVLSSKGDSICTCNMIDLSNDSFKDCVYVDGKTINKDVDFLQY